MQGKPLIELDDVLLRHCTGATVITANERLQRALRDACDRHHAAAGMEAPPSPRIHTPGTYLRERYGALQSTGHATRELLTADAQRFVWLECSPQSADLDVEGLYDTIAAAWRILHDWELFAALVQFNDNENHRLFRNWAEAYRRKALLNGWVTEPELPAAIADAIQANELAAEPLLMLGFDVVPPSLQRLIDASRAAGQTITMHRPSRRVADQVAAVSADDPQQELRAAIHWARELLSDGNATVSIGIVVPDPSQFHDRVARELDVILRPNDLEADPDTSPYNISGGIPLSTLPVIADALEFLDWLFEPIHYSRVARILGSPFLSLEAAASKAEDAVFPESYDAAYFSAHVSASPLRDVVAWVGRIGLVDLKTAILELRQLLARAGWPNPTTLTGESFQAYRAFEALFDELNSNTRFIQPRHISAMARHVRRTADRRLFAAQRPRRPLQVLGYLETVGLEFTHLWVTGLNHVDWPATPQPNPFIPLRLLRSAGVPRIDSESEVAFARRMTSRWRHAARSVVFSYARHGDEALGRLSPLIGELLQKTRPDEIRSAHPAHPYLVPQTALVDWDDIQPGPARIEQLRHRGTGILRDQSACPFRAFARYRLHAIEQSLPHSFPDATERGVATHAALRDTFERLDRVLDPIDPQSFEDVIESAASRALETYRRIPAQFRSSEHRRLTNLLREWMQVERSRAPFQVVANERTTTLSLAGIEFQLRIDRIDQLSVTGELLVIDYKTGATPANVVFGDRPEEPQLPMYALSEPQTTSIAFAQVRRNQCRLIGWSEKIRSSANVRFAPPPAEYGGHWEALAEVWTSTLSRLAGEFRRGTVDVDPRDAKVCRECNLHTLCRVREIRHFEPD